MNTKAYTLRGLSIDSWTRLISVRSVDTYQQQDMRFVFTIYEAFISQVAPMRVHALIAASLKFLAFIKRAPLATYGFRMCVGIEGCFYG